MSHGKGKDRRSLAETIEAVLALSCQAILWFDTCVRDEADLDCVFKELDPIQGADRALPRVCPANPARANLRRKHSPAACRNGAGIALQVFHLWQVLSTGCPLTMKASPVVPHPLGLSSRRLQPCEALGRVALRRGPGCSQATAEGARSSSSSRREGTFTNQKDCKSCSHKAGSDAVSSPVCKCGDPAPRPSKAGWMACLKQGQQKKIDTDTMGRSYSNCTLRTIVLPRADVAASGGIFRLGW